MWPNKLQAIPTCALKAMKGSLMLLYAYHISLLELTIRVKCYFSDYHVNTFGTVTAFYIFLVFWVRTFQLHCWLLWFCSLFKCCFSSSFSYSIIFNKYTVTGNLICYNLFKYCLFTRFWVYFIRSHQVPKLLTSTVVGSAWLPPHAQQTEIHNIVWVWPSSSRLLFL